MIEISSIAWHNFKIFIYIKLSLAELMAALHGFILNFSLRSKYTIQLTKIIEEDITLFNATKFTVESF